MAFLVQLSTRDYTTPQSEGHGLVGVRVHFSLGANAQCDPAILSHAVTWRRPVPEMHPIAPKLEHTPAEGRVDSGEAEARIAG
jgi:hypothetical protein